MGCPVCPIKELFSCPHGCVENTLTHFLFLLIEILAWMFNIWGAWKSHTVPCAFSGYHSDPPHPQRGPHFCTRSCDQSPIRFNRVKSGRTQPKTKCLESVQISRGRVCTLQTVTQSLSRTTEETQTNSGTAPPPQLCSRVHRKVLGLDGNTPHYCFHAPFFLNYFSSIECANTWC